MTARSLLVATLLAAVPATASAQISADYKVILPFKAIVAKANESTVRVLCDEKDAALGTVVFEDGYILTKASELRGALSVLLPDGSQLDAKLVGRHKETDLALLKVENGKKLTPVKFSDSTKAPLGCWLVSAGSYKDSEGLTGVGILSAKVRTLKGEDSIPFNHNRGFMGVTLDSAADPKDDEGNVLGAKVKLVTRKSPASEAGIKPNDIITTVNGIKVLGVDSLQESMEGSRPGEKVKLTVLRIKKDKDQEETSREELKLELKLGGEDDANKSRGDLQNSLGSSLSGRRTGFPAVIQTDLVLAPKNCGGPIIDLDGNVLGIGIARAGRVESWILPGENIKPLLQDLKAGKYAPVSKTVSAEK
jgi:serine protease Do